MSHQASRRAVDWQGGTRIQRAVLSVIGIETDHRTDWAEGPGVSLTALASKTGWARSNVAIAVEQLVAMGVLERTSGRGEANKYHVVGGAIPPGPDGGSPARSEVVLPDRTTWLNEQDGGSPAAVLPDRTGVVLLRGPDQLERGPLEKRDLEESRRTHTPRKEAPPLPLTRRASVGA